MTFYYINVQENMSCYHVADEVPNDVKVLRKINHFSHLQVGDMVQIEGKHYLVIDNGTFYETVFLFSLDRKYDDLEFGYHENFNIVENIRAFPSNHNLKVGDKVQVDIPGWFESDETFEVVAVYPENNVIDVYNKKRDIIKTVAQFCSCKKEERAKITCYITKVEPQVIDGYTFEFFYKHDSAYTASCPITLFLKYYDAYWLTASEKRNPNKDKIIRQTLETIVSWMKEQGVTVSYRNLKTILCENAREMFDEHIKERKIEITSDNN